MASEGFYKSDTFKSSNDDTWTTPRKFYDGLNEEFNFSLDAAALESSTLCINNWYGPDHPETGRRDAFSRDWALDSNGGTVWLNPPYGRTIKSWVAKAQAEVNKGAKVVLLVPSRTDTAWWHDHCIEYEIRFIRGRLKFGNQKNAAPFPSAVVVMSSKPLLLS